MTIIYLITSLRQPYIESATALSDNNNNNNNYYYYYYYYYYKSQETMFFSGRQKLTSYFMGDFSGLCIQENGIHLNGK